MKFLITGGAGFIGRNLCRRLHDAGHEVVGIDNGSRHGVDCYPWEVIRADCRVRPYHRGNADWIIHAAAINGTRNFYERPGEVLQVGIAGTEAMLEWAREWEVPNFLFMSSSETYHVADKLPTPENVPLKIPDLRNPRFSYSASKIAGEFLSYYSDIPHVVIARPHNVYGENMGTDHVIPALIGKARSGRVDIQGDGSQTRSFCWIDDCIDALMLIIEKGGNREVYNIGNDEPTTISQLACRIISLMGLDVPLEQGQEPEGSPRIRIPDISKLRALGYEPKVSLADGLRRLIA